MFIITNVKVVLLDRIAENLAVWIEGDVISKIDKVQLNYPNTHCVIDGKGGYLSPGFIDIHSDYIEHITAPRPSALMDFNLALRESERELLTHGITTMFHSLSLYKEEQVYSKPIRKKENVEKLIDVISSTHLKKHLIRHRFHARFELDNVDSVEDLKEYIERGAVDLLSFMDHTPGQGQYRDVKKYKEMSKGYDSQMTDETFEKKLQQRLEAPKLSFEACVDIAKHAGEKGIAVASHDDDTVEKIDNLNKIGATISEFPITLDVAKYAHEKGFYTIAGAPNVMLGGSHSGNLAAYKAIEEGVIDILCSDYYPAALLHAVFKLHKDYGHPLHEMFKLVTLNPAKAVKVDGEIGTISIGKKADLIIIETIEEDFPVITSCFVNGAHVLETRYRS